MPIFDPNKIKRGLDCCMEDGNCHKCPYFSVEEGLKCTMQLASDAYYYTLYLERQNATLLAGWRGVKEESENVKNH